MNRNEAERILLDSGWLSQVPAGFQREVLRRAVLARHEADSYLYRMGDAPGGIYGLVQGNLAINSAPAHVTPKLMQLGRPGAWTGEGSYLTRQPRLIELQAKTPTWVMHLPLDQMDAMTFHDPRVIRHFALILMHTVHVLVQMVSDLQIPDPARRIAATIERATLQYSRELPLTQTALGEMSCATRRQVGIALKDFSDRGWLDAMYGRIVIRDAAALRAFAQSE